MRFIPAPGQLLLLSAAAGLVSANPLPRDDLHDFGWSFLMPRECNSYCGSDNQFCCDSSEVCTTISGSVATCVAAGGSWGGYTTTWTETRTYTSTVMTNWIPAPEPTAGVDCVPKNDQQEACGSICCAGWQTCAYKGQCSAKPGYDEPTTVVITTDGHVTTQYSAPYRVTGTTTLTTSGVRSTDATTTNSADGAAGTGDSDKVGGADGGGGGGGLSGGAIAGIVIGALAGVALLLLLCFCCIARGLWHAIFGRKKEHKERVDVYEERYSRHGSRVPSAVSRKDRHTGWFGMGGRPSSAGDRRSEKKKSNGKMWLGLAGAAATLLALLNLRKDKKPARKPARSRYSDSYYSYSDATSPSSSSSGARSHYTRRTRDSRGPSRGPPRSQYSHSRRS